MISTQGNPSSAANASTSSSFRSPRIAETKPSCMRHLWMVDCGCESLSEHGTVAGPLSHGSLPASSLVSPILSVDTYGCGRPRQHDRGAKQVQEVIAFRRESIGSLPCVT